MAIQLSFSDGLAGDETFSDFLDQQAAERERERLEREASMLRIRSPERAPALPQMQQQQQQQPQQGGGVNPLQAYNTYQKFAGGGAAGGGTAGSVGSSGGATAGGMTHAASGSGMVPAGGGAGGGWGSTLSAAGPWAALAAVIAANEYSQNQAGNRPDDNAEWAQDAFTGKVLERDMSRYGEKIGGPVGEGVEQIGRFAHPKGVWDASVDGIRKVSRWLGGLF